MNIIRWIILLPVSYVVGMIIMMIINVFFASAIPGGLEAIDTEFSFYKLLRQILSGLAQGFVFVALGITIAPDYKKNTAITLLLIQILLIITIMLFGPGTASWQAKIGGIAQIVGSILAFNIYLKRI